MSQLDKELQDLFRRQAAQQRSVSEKKKECLSELAVCRYLGKKSDAAEKERIEDHLVECYDCLQAVGEAAKAKTAFERGELKSDSGRQWMGALRQKLPPQKTRPAKQKTRLWLAAMVAAFIGSFVFRRYFVQFSAAALLFGIKWIVETRATKVLIAIQDAWQRGDRQSAEELLEKLGKRR